MEKEFVFKVMGEGKAIIKLTDNSIIISRSGIMSKISYGLVGEKTIFLNEITSVQMKKSTTFTTGFLQFIVPGTIEAKKGVKDENTVYFKDPWGHYAEENKNAEFIKKYVEDYKLKSNQFQQGENGNTNLDEIKKLKELLDIGAVSQEEYDAKKKELLGL